VILRAGRINKTLLIFGTKNKVFSLKKAACLAAFLNPPNKKGLTRRRLSTAEHRQPAIRWSSPPYYSPFAAVRKPPGTSAPAAALKSAAAKPTLRRATAALSQPAVLLTLRAAPKQGNLTPRAPVPVTAGASIHNANPAGHSCPNTPYRYQTA